MAIFRYIASDTSGKELRGAMDAATAQDVVARLSERGYRQVQVVGAAAAQAVGAGAVSTASAGGAVLRQRPTAATSSVGVSVPQTSRGFAFETARSQDIGTFFRQMGSLVHSGYTVSAALSDLGMRTGARALGRAAAEMGRATASGSAMAPLMVNYPGLFAPHMVGLVAAGETGGFVEFSFEEIALGAEQDAALRQGLWFTKLLIWNAVWTVLTLGPLFSSIDVHKMTSGTVAGVVSGFSGYVHALAWVIPLGIGLHIAAHVIGTMRHQPFARDFFDRISLSIPVMVKLARMRALASFTRVLRRLLMSGISPSLAYAGAVQAVPNAALRERFGWGNSIIRGGQGIDAALQATGLMQNDPLQMLVTGQKTGQWLEMLDRVTAHYQEEAARSTEGAKNFQKRLGVLLTIIVTGYVICVSTYGGYQIMFKVADEMSK